MVSYEQGHPISLKLPVPTPGEVPATCITAVLQLAGLSPKFQRVSDLQDSQERRYTETPKEAVLCPLGLIGKLRLGLVQQLNSSLELVLTVDMASHLSEAGDCTVLNKLQRRIWGWGGISIQNIMLRGKVNKYLHRYIILH